jgi:hypothetical protein
MAQTAGSNAHSTSVNTVHERWRIKTRAPERSSRATERHEHWRLLLRMHDRMHHHHHHILAARVSHAERQKPKLQRIETLYEYVQMQTILVNDLR